MQHDVWILPWHESSLVYLMQIWHILACISGYAVGIWGWGGYIWDRLEMGFKLSCIFFRSIEVSNKYPIDLVWSRKYLLHNYFIKNSGTLAYIVLGFATSFPKSLSCSGKLSNIQSIYRYQNLSYLSFWPFNFRFHIILVLDFELYMEVN